MLKNISSKAMCGRYYASCTHDRMLVTEMCPGFKVYFSSKEKPLETKILFDVLTPYG